ncbi:hypothetical protein JVU11DRAFT_721 [Chiua virens]|nr:hypothetical protein JVU11DRAFT_721 [Chiua virens]
MPSPIRLVEFTTALARCIPVTPNPRIAIANSGGPDSTCLLFLLSQVFPPRPSSPFMSSITSNRPSSVMADVAATNARLFGIPHHAESIPWGSPPFPPLPAAGSIERTARDARYNILFHSIKCARISFLSLGHHADDQLETAIMRIACGSSLIGAAGMRPLRRWGMGSPHSPLAWSLVSSISLLFLTSSQDRILATCIAHQLHHINDPTNSQPHITLRNTIRHCLHHDPSFSHTVPLPPTASLCFPKIKQAASTLHSIAPNVTNEKDRLFTAVVNLRTAARNVDHKVTSHLANYTLPSPIGTLLLSSFDLLIVTDPRLRSALVLRVMRYVSFHPWGSLSADAHRRQSSIRRIAIVSAWLASRTPPFLKNPQQGAGSPTRLVIDLTKQLRDAISSCDPLEILYDCRFLLRINSLQIPTHVKSVPVQSRPVGVDQGPSVHTILLAQSRPPARISSQPSLGSPTGQGTCGRDEIPVMDFD